MQTTIIAEMKVKPQIDVTAEIETRVEFIKSQLVSSGLKCLVLGISGGQDSSLTGKLCQMAVDELNSLEPDTYKFIAMRLPYGVQFDEDDCSLALDFIKPSELITYNIKPVVDCHLDTFKKMEIEISDFNKGNIKARERMIAQYAIAGQNRGLVVGTDHSSEAITGFYTKHGDGAADLTPIFGLNKRQGKELLKALNAPERLYLKTPTADLEEDKPALPDEVSLGVTYEQIDDYLEGKQIDSDAVQIIEGHFKKTAHKRMMAKTIYNN